MKIRQAKLADLEEIAAIELENFSSEERAKVEEAKKYLEEKGYVVTGKSKFPVGGLNILSVSSLPMYYKAAKTVAKFIL